MAEVEEHNNKRTFEAEQNEEQRNENVEVEAEAPHRVTDSAQLNSETLVVSSSLPCHHTARTLRFNHTVLLFSLFLSFFFCVLFLLFLMKVVNNSVRVCVCVFDAADLQGSSTAHKGGKDESKVRAFLYFYFKLS